MRRITLVLAAATLMVAMLVAFSAPAMAKNNDHNHKQHNKQHSNNNHHQGFNDTVLVLGNGFGHDDDFETELEDGDDDDFEINLDDGNDVSVISPFFALGCWEWSWVFERWEWDCD